MNISELTMADNSYVSKETSCLPENFVFEKDDPLFSDGNLVSVPEESSAINKSINRKKNFDYEYKWWELDIIFHIHG
ncbi:hypothetical protein AB3U99_03780 [Niallia sp. JL1B1071]|uniref:hypothetical protein n=1 Tax=Niallia tiangongensis TaxID=3237105 RepID=UPI0037DC49A3